MVSNCGNIEPKKILLDGIGPDEDEWKIVVQGQCGVCNDGKSMR